MPRRQPYHSALTPPGDWPPADRWEGRGCVAFRHDIFKGLPAEFAGCDLLYGDPPWAGGYLTFNVRAGAMGQPDFRSFIGRLDWTARTSGKPTVYVVGQRDARAYRADSALPVRLNGAPALALSYGADLPARLGNEIRPDAGKLLQYLARRYARVGDFLCGYGRSARAFAQAGRTFVASDFDARCVGYVAAHAEEWFP